MSAEQYRVHAAQCVLLAQQTTDPQSKLVLLHMARAWLQLGELAGKTAQIHLVSPKSQDPSKTWPTV